MRDPGAYFDFELLRLRDGQLSMEGAESVLEGQTDDLNKLTAPEISLSLIHESSAPGGYTTYAFVVTDVRNGRQFAGKPFRQPGRYSPTPMSGEVIAAELASIDS